MLTQGDGGLEQRFCLRGLQTRLEHNPVDDIRLAPFRPARLDLTQYLLSLFGPLKQFAGNSFREEELGCVRHNTAGLLEHCDRLTVLFVFDQEERSLKVEIGARRRGAETAVQVLRRLFQLS